MPNIKLPVNSKLNHNQIPHVPMQTVMVTVTVSDHSQ